MGDDFISYNLEVERELWKKFKLTWNKAYGGDKDKIDWDLNKKLIFVLELFMEQY